MWILKRTSFFEVTVPVFPDFSSSYFGEYRVEIKKRTEIMAKTTNFRAKSLYVRTFNWKTNRSISYIADPSLLQ